MLFKEGSVISNKLVLVGMPLSGKTTIARILSGKLNLPHFDCDVIIENKFKVAVSKFISEYGIAKFREEESVIIKETLAKGVPLIFSLGGGGFISKENRNLLLSKSLCVYLNVNANILNKRYKIYSHQVANSESEYSELYNKRKFLYELSHIKISIKDETTEEICKLIIEKINCQSEI